MVLCLVQMLLEKLKQSNPLNLTSHISSNYYEKLHETIGAKMTQVKTNQISQKHKNIFFFGEKCHFLTKQNKPANKLFLEFVNLLNLSLYTNISHLLLKTKLNSEAHDEKVVSFLSQP